MKRHNCQARQYGDQMMCAACGLNWDTNDQEPPKCGKAADQRAKKARFLLSLQNELAAMRPAGKLPDKLPDDVAAEMVKTYQANGGHNTGMQAAYRLFLDRVEP